MRQSPATIAGLPGLPVAAGSATSGSARQAMAESEPTCRRKEEETETRIGGVSFADTVHTDAGYPMALNCHPRTLQEDDVPATLTLRSTCVRYDPPAYGGLSPPLC